MDKKQQGVLLRNKLLNEIRCYESVIGDMTVYPGAMTDVAQTLTRRANDVVRNIAAVYDSYQGCTDAWMAFVTDYPDLEDVVTQLATYQPDAAGNFMISDLRALGRQVQPVSPSPATAPSANLAGRGNIFSKPIP